MKMIFKLGCTMTKRCEYNTKQKEIIFDVIKKQKHEFTIKDIYNEISDRTGLTTIYRLVDKLVEDGILNKNISIENITYYYYLGDCNKDNHFYLKCDKCGNMSHIDCDCIGNISSHILKKHGFRPSKKKIIINGTCEKCLERNL